MQRRRFTNICKRPRMTTYYRVTSVVFGLMGLFQLVRGSVHALTFAGLLILAGLNAFARMATNGGALLVSRNAFIHRIVQFEWIVSFEWRHDTQNHWAYGRRLWIILDDGQAISTPVTTPGGWLGRDIVMSQAEADEFVSKLEQLRTR